MFILKKLPYEYRDLIPLFSEKQLETHYLKHHKTYCDNFNKSILDFDVEGKSVLEIINDASKYNQTLINHGGGF
ncbi:protein containing Manganese/iron superoxide dismutase, N-terminal domain [sediment metagenome]|uniref:superoxide dismutase n=1 Tax=sediment metagenome TaxID=749907 RepID=D9PLA0_9ZZZZ